MDRRDFLASLGAAGLASLWPARGAAIGDASRTTIARLQHPGRGWDGRPSSIRVLLQEVEKRTSIFVETDYPTLHLSDDALFQHPFVSMIGDRGYDPLPEEPVSKLRSYLQSGGFLFVDSFEGVGDGEFMSAVERTLGRAFPDKEIGTVPDDHVLFKSFYLIDEAVGRVDVSPELQAVFDSDRLYAVISQNDLFGALARLEFGDWRYEVRPGGEKQRERAMRLGINLLMYALCVNYKSDQVHVPFILKRRKWKVD